MHILVLPSFYPSKDNENLGFFFREQVETLADYNNKIGVVYVEMKSLKKISFKNIFSNHFQFIRIKEKNWIELRLKGWKLPGLIGDKIWLYLTNKLIKKYIDQNGTPDVIHVHNAFLAGQVAFRIFKKYGIKYILTEHDSAFLFESFTTKKKSIISEVYLNAFQVISVSNGLKNAMNLIAPDIKIEVIPNIVNTDYFKPKQNTYDSVVTTFLSIGNLTANKNHKLLINGFNEIAKLNNNVQLIICGDGPEKNKLIKLVESLKLQDRVHLKGFLDRERILYELQNADCLVHTSNLETFGVVLIEAISCGLPFISTNSGGPQDVYEDEMGYLIEKNNLKELTSALLLFLKNKNSFNSILLRKIAFNKYSRDAVYKKLNRICSEIDIRY